MVVINPGQGGADEPKVETPHSSLGTGRGGVTRWESISTGGLPVCLRVLIALHMFY